MGRVSQKAYWRQQQDAFAIVLEFMRTERFLTDVTVVCGGREFPAHRCQLCAASPFFLAHFKSSQAPTDRLQLDSVSADSMECILEYIYSGVFPAINEDTGKMRELIEASGFLQMQLLFLYCIQSCVNVLSMDYFLKQWQVGELSGCRQLSDRVVKLTAVNFGQVAGGEQFLDLTVAQLTQLLDSSDLKVAPTHVVLRGLLNWVRCKEDERVGDMEGLLAKVNFERASGGQLEVVMEDPVVKGNGKILEVIATKKAEADSRPKHSRRLLFFRRRMVSTYDLEERHFLATQHVAHGFEECQVTAAASCDGRVYVVAERRYPAENEDEDDDADSAERQVTDVTGGEGGEEASGGSTGRAGGAGDGDDDDAAAAAADGGGAAGAGGADAGDAEDDDDADDEADDDELCEYMAESGQFRSGVYEYVIDDNVMRLVGVMSVTDVNALAVVNGLIYVVGGEDEDGDDSRATQRFNPLSREHEVLADTNDTHLAACVFGFRDHVYVTSAASQTRLERYDTLYDQWTVVAFGGETLPRLVYGSMTQDGRLFADVAASGVGGVGSGGSVKEAHVYTEIKTYNVATGEWRETGLTGDAFNFTDVWECSVDEKGPSYLALDGESVLYVFHESGEWMPLTQKIDENAFRTVLVDRFY